MNESAEHQPTPSPAEPPDAAALHQMPFRWVMLALLWLLYFSFGMVTRSPSPLITPIINDLNMLYGQMGFVLGPWQMTYIVLAIMAGIIMDRWGIKKSILTGAFFLVSMGVIILALMLPLKIPSIAAEGKT